MVFSEQANALGTYRQVPWGIMHNKKMIKLSKKTFLKEQVSVIIENKALVKYKDPGCPPSQFRLETRSSKELC